MIKKYNKKDTIILLISIVCIIISLCFLFSFYKNVKIISNFEEDINSLSEDYNNPIFSLDKIILYSNCDFEILDDKNPTTLNVNISQYSDIAIYLKQSDSSLLTDTNIVKEVYLDNFNFTSIPKIGNPKLYEKGLYDFGKYTYSDEKNINDKLTYNVSFETIDLNKKEISYDLSTPITFGYVNNKLKENYNISNFDENFNLDGNLLKKASISINDLSCNISFDIHLINNLDEHFICKISIPIELQNNDSSLYNGDIYYELADLKNFIFYKCK